MPDENPSGLGIFDLPLRSPGQYFDKETNLHYNYYRDYDPSIGRYGQSDPIGLAGGLNTYGYGNQSPLMYIDPKGQSSICVVGVTPQDLCYEECFWAEIQTCLTGAPALCGLGAAALWYTASISPQAAVAGFAGCTIAVGGVCAVQKQSICKRRCYDQNPDPGDPWNPNKYPWQRSPWYK